MTHVARFVALDDAICGSQEGGFYSWCSLYGSPAENTGSEADAMNENPEIASVWKGMVLMHFAAEETDKPKKGMVTMEPEIKRRAEELGYFETEAYELIFEVGQGITLPGKDSDYKVRITVQENSWSTELPKEKSFVAHRLEPQIQNQEEDLD